MKSLVLETHGSNFIALTIPFYGLQIPSKPLNGRGGRWAEMSKEGRISLNIGQQ